jgi:hypothetical protein
MDDAAQWTLDELSELVAGALRVVDYEGQPSRRVREVPDRRTIRWYTTIGLLDRPAAMRGRTALYGRRHLIQLVAVKRLQAQGHSLVEVQSELVGATDAAIESIARIPAGLALSNGLGGAVDEAPIPAQVPVPEPTPAQALAEIAAPAQEPAQSQVATRSTLRFWAAAPAGVDEREADEDDDTVTEYGSVTEADGTESTDGLGSAALDQPAVTTLPALRLGSGVTLLLGAAGRTPTAEDARLIDEAARPLLDLLLRRGLDVPDLGREIR